MLRRVRHRFNYPRAHQDEPYLDLAAAAQATFLVSRDLDLLALRNEYSTLAKEIRRSCRRLRIVDPVEFLRAIRDASWR